jgi:hypothetical protein
MDIVRKLNIFESYTPLSESYSNYSLNLVSAVELRLVRVYTEFKNVYDFEFQRISKPRIEQTSFRKMFSPAVRS